MGDTVSLIVFSIVCGVGGQLALKVGMAQVGRIGAQALAQPIATALRVGTSPYVVGGMGLYVLGAVAWLTVLSRIPLSLAYPALALSYAFTPVLAWLLLGESVTSLRWVGIGIIALGVVVVSRS
jgi:drug/metabolite transporter (DMT)-like permease